MAILCSSASQPAFGYKASLYEIAMLKGQYPDLNSQQAAQVAVSLNQLTEKAYQKAALGGGVGLIFGVLTAVAGGKISPTLSRGIRPVLVVMGGIVTGVLAGVASIWPQSKAWYANVRNLSRTTVGAWADKLYGYQSSSN